MQKCAEHVPYQLPKAHTQVTHFLDNIQCDNAPLLAAMVLVTNNKVDRNATGLAKTNDFEATAAFIISHDPVVIKHQNKRGLAHISSLGGDNPSS